MRYPLKAHLRVLRPGKAVPPVVVSSHLHFKGIGTIHTGSGDFYVRRMTHHGNGPRELCLDCSTWTAPWEAPRRAYP